MFDPFLGAIEVPGRSVWPRESCAVLHRLIAPGISGFLLPTFFRP